MKILLTSLSIAAMIGLSGCGGSGDSSAVTTSKLKGTWEGSCINLPDATSEKTILVFEKEKFTRSSFQYSDIGCNKEDNTDDMDVYYSYELGDDVNTEDGKKATKISSTITGFLLKKGNLTNGNIPQAGTVEKGIVLIDNDKLYRGEDKVPYKLNYQQYLQKVKK
ncbi:MAG: hypothetical protein DSZ05_06770 [Sulfurospirillum sp.]|nr:MAG: hypothetical protein DSZ05_06770 [Sulfurospirillum sp.]